MNHEVKKELNNKGFSLIELIIVVAIMAVLIGVLAPQYLKYVEKSRQSADLASYESIISAIETYATDPSITWTNGKVTCSTTAVMTATGSVKDALIAAGIMPASGTSTLKMKSTLYGSCEIEAEKDATTGFITLTFTNNNAQTALGR